MRKLAFFLVTLIAVAGCKKAEDRKCWKFSGEDATLTIPFANTDKFSLRSKLNYAFIQDSTNVIVLKGGKNLLNLVTVADNNGTIEIGNENKCGFLRKEGNWVDVEIHFTSLRNVMFTGSDKLTGSVKTDYLTLVVNHGSGTIEMDIDAIAVTAKALEGFGNFTLSGHASVGDFTVTSNGYCDTYNLALDDSLKVLSNTVSYMKVNAQGVPMTGALLGKGNILYHGNPELIDIINTGTGLVYKDQ